MWCSILLLSSLVASSRSQYLSNCPQWCYCAAEESVKGVIRQAVCSGVMPPQISSTMKHFTVRDANLPILSPAMFNSYTLIESLQMTQCGIKTIEPGSFSALGNIHIIRLSYNKLNQLTPAMFQGVTTLTELYCDNNQIKFIEPNTFTGLAQLEILDLHNNQMSQLPSGKLPPKLYQLNLEGNNIQDMPPDFDFNSMKDLNLCGNTLTQFKVIQTHLPNLAELCIGDMPTIIVPQTFQTLKDLKQLSLSSKKHPDSDLPFQVYNGIKFLLGLTKLRLEYYRLSNLSFIEPLTNLKTLELVHITNVVLVTEKTFVNKTHLTLLDLTGSPHLAKVIISSDLILQQLSRLTTLVLRDCVIHAIDRGAWVNTLVNLQHVDMSLNPLHCDCRLSWMVKNPTINKKIHFIDDKSTLCATPPDLANQQVLSLKFDSCVEMKGTMPPMLHPGDAVKHDKFRSNKGKMSENTILYIVLGILVFLIIALIVAFVVYRYCIKKRGFESIDGSSVPMQSQK